MKLCFLMWGVANGVNFIKWWTPANVPKNLRMMRRRESINRRGSDEENI